MGHLSIADVPSSIVDECDIDHYLVVAKVWDRLSVSKRRAQKLDM
jgi:hypothetical protein